MPESTKVATEVLTITTVGGGGAATGHAHSNPLYGGLLAVYLNYDAAAPGTTVVTLTDDYGTIVAFVASNTDARWCPRLQACDAAGAVIPGVYDIPPLCGVVTVTVTLSDALAAAVVATLVYLKA